MTIQQQQLTIEGQSYDAHFYLFNRLLTHASYTTDPASTISVPRFLIVFSDQLFLVGSSGTDKVWELVQDWPGSETAPGSKA